MEKREPGQLIEYAVSGRSSCKHCQQAIAEGALRIGHETRSFHHDGFDVSWHHVACFKKRHGATVQSLSDLRHCQTLRWVDQQTLRATFEGRAGPENAELRAHSERLWKVRDLISANCKPKDIKFLLEYNGMSIDGKASVPWLTHRLADAMAFGRIGLCPECKTDGLTHNSVEYVCYGHFSEFTRCSFKGSHPDIVRYRFKIPAKGIPKPIAAYDAGPDHPKGEFVPLKRVRDDESSGGGGDEGEAAAVAEAPSKKKKASKSEGAKKAKCEGAKTEEKFAPAAAAGAGMAGMNVAVVGTKAELGMTLKEIKELVVAHGGLVTTKINANTTALVTSQKELDKKKASAKLASAKELNVAIVTMDWLLEQCGGAGAQAQDADQGKQGGEGKERKTLLEEAPVRSGASKGEEGNRLKRSTTEAEGQVKYREKPLEGSDILEPPPSHPGCRVLVTHDPVFGYTAYKAVLNTTDVATGTNKFYRMFVLKDQKGKYRLVASWGRIGTDTGGEMDKVCADEEVAIAMFVEKFEKFCDFRWDKRYRYVKQPGKYLWVSLDDGVQASKEAAEGVKPLKMLKSVASGSGIVLDQRVREFLALIFDQDMMTSTLIKFNVDVKKMPLGKINPRQILKGYEVLSSISEMLKSSSPSPALLADASNQFYTLIPHDFGHQAPPLIATIEQVKSKIQLVEALMEIGDSVEIMQQETTHDPLIGHYSSLRSDMAPLDRNSARFELLSKYMHEGHDASNFEFGVKVKDIFEIKRHDEHSDKHYGAFRELDNRKLLWHGSRLSNWGGILGKGLRIAPPEAPKTGYRLGKGIYLADTVSKSGSYCFTDKDRPVGVMMLAEAALGKQFVTKKDTYMEKPQPDTHSTFAIGEVAPDPSHTAKIESVHNQKETVAVPCGPPKSTGTKSQFVHDEYVVYDVKQVTMRYVFIVEFDHTPKRRGRR